MAGLGHIAVGLAAGRVASGRSALSFSRAAIVLSGLSLLPDLDVVAFALGIPYEAPWGHRGASHSLVGAAVVAVVGAAALRGRMAARIAVPLCFAVVASHGLLDALTDGGRGVALAWPYADTRMFAPWRPIPVSPIGLGLLSARGARVIATELVVFAPLWLWALWPRATSSDAPDPDA